MFLGENLLSSHDQAVIFFFQGAAKLTELGQWDQSQDAVEFDVLTMKEDMLEHVFDYSGCKNKSN